MGSNSKNKAPGRPGGPRFARPAEKPKDFKGTLKRLLGYIRPYTGKLIVVILMAILSTVFAVGSPKVMGLATTSLMETVRARISGVEISVDRIYITKILMILMGMYVFSALFAYAQRYLMAGVTQGLVYELRKEVDEKLSKLPLRYYDNNQTGDILSRVTNDMDTISSTLQDTITQSITSLIKIIGMGVMMLIISPFLTLVTLITIPLSGLVIRMISKRSQAYFSAQSSNIGKLNGHIEEMYSGHTVIKAFSREEQSLEEFNRVNEEVFNSSQKAVFMSGMMRPLMGFINNIGYVFIAIFGSRSVITGALSIGDMQAFIQYSKEWTQPIMQVADIANIIQSTIASAERVFQVLDEEEEIPEKEETLELGEVRGEVEFKDVSFSYNKDEKLIENMNIRVKPGETVAIVGPTGAGKTTLVNLLMRFYEIDSGSITIDGVDIRDMKRGDLRRTFGMVLQNTWLFKGTIKENIAYGRAGATDEEICNAAKMAQADFFIRTLPDGYETVLDEGASNISQGQKQLLTIARAMISNADITILDEATSSVDTRTEILIQKAMDQVMKDRTSFVIAHRLSTIKNADMILVMDEGTIIEQGTHEELLERNGFYADLYRSQFAA